MSCSGYAYGSGCNSTAFTTVKIPVVAPIPSVRHRTAAVVNPRFLRIIRTANWTSCHSVSIGYPPPGKGTFETCCVFLVTEGGRRARPVLVSLQYCATLPLATFACYKTGDQPGQQKR